ncbi:uncharacterized protein UDID_17822 [Ustilago sp. UG-2017a]|nr:uncharacterized protein UDID_17822 [Ustilago sp. UG-2017a]
MTHLPNSFMQPSSSKREREREWVDRGCRTIGPNLDSHSITVVASIAWGSEDYSAEWMVSVPKHCQTDFLSTTNSSQSSVFIESPQGHERSSGAIWQGEGVGAIYCPRQPSGGTATEIYNKIPRRGGSNRG